MFIYSVRAGTLKLFALILAVVAVLLTVTALDNNTAVYASVGDRTINYGGMKTEDDRVAFIESFGLKINRDSVKSEVFSIPDELGRILLGYNELQKTQGLDVSKYTGKRVTRYCYEVTNYDYDGAVFVNLIIYRNRIIACDISSGDPDGFVLPLTRLDTEKIK